MTIAAVSGRDAVWTDRAEDPPRFSRRWFRRVAADFRRERAAFGLRSTLREFAFRAIHHVVSFKVLRGIYLAGADARFTECPTGFTGGFLDSETLERVSPDFQTRKGYEVARPGEANMSMSTTQLAERYGCVSMTLEMPFKDNFDLPDEVYGWSTERSKYLAGACLDTLHAILPELREAKAAKAKSEKVEA